MRKGILSITLTLTLAAITVVHGSIPGFIDETDKHRFQAGIAAALTTTIKNNDLASAYHATRSITLLKEGLVLVLRLDNCGYVSAENLDQEKVVPEEIYQKLAVFQMLECGPRPQFPDKIHTAKTVQNLKAVLEDDKATIAELRWSLEALILLGEKIPAPEKVASKLQAKLKEDDGLISMGHVLHAASILGNAGKFALQLVEDIIVQADEIDGKMLQWEGGLTTTSLLLTGLLRLPNAPPLTQVQADKFGIYLLSRKTVNSARGISALAEATTALAASKVSPVCVSVIGPAQVTQEQPDLKVRVSDLLGEPLKASVGPVVAQSATRLADDVVVLSKQPLSPGTQPTEYVLPLKLEAGLYRIAISVGSQSSTLAVKVLGNVNLQWLDVGIADVDQTSAAKLTRLAHPNKLTAPLQADSSQHLIVKFSLTRTVHQAFIRLSKDKTEIVFVAEIDSGKVYKVDVDLAGELGQSGNFEIELIVGDFIMSNPIRWTIGSVQLKIPASAVKAATTDKQASRGMKPEIVHQFRPAEKRPPQPVSMLFTVLCSAPLLLLLGLWLKLGINLRNFSFSLGALGFHAGLISIMGLFTVFWMRLDMFTTCGWLLVLGGFTFISGHRLLSQLAEKRKKS